MFRLIITAVASALALNGCTTTNSIQVKEAYKNHVIAINKHGDIVDDEQKLITDTNLHFQDVLHTSDKDKIVIYIHGGLNTPDSTNETVKHTPDENNKFVNISELIKEDGYHPIFISWRSGFLTTYYDHLFNQRKGEYWPKAGIPTSPLIFLADLGKGLSRFPITWWYQTSSYLKGISFSPTNESISSPDQRNAIKINNELLPDHTFGEVTKLTAAFDTRSTSEKLIDSTLGFAKLIPGLVVIPFADSLATGAWDVMKQRTEVMFTKEKPWKADGYQTINEYTDIREAGLTKFLKKLEDDQKENHKEIILVGHSMGTIISNKILLEHPNIKFSKIIYMGAACSIKDFQASVLPYLKVNSDTQFFNNMLHPIAENLEAYAIVGAGSLLTLIDNVFENHKTLGKWVNVMNGINFFNISDSTIKSRIHLRTMKLDKTSYPTKHGSFDDSEYSATPNKGFWTANFGT
jgi:hypothetical protein